MVLKVARAAAAVAKASLLRTTPVSIPTAGVGGMIRTYSEWVIYGEYDWPPRCCKCQAVLEEGDGSVPTRLGCLHVIHTNCLVSHIKSFPPHTAPAGYACPSCSTSIWPPKSVKDSASRLHSLLKEAIMQTGMEKNLFGNHPVSLPTTDPRGPPPAFASVAGVYI
ncbi:zinc finger protein-like 1 homolog [Hibiscus syriacus]|uniref:zinc finger protein-like 1 homolog n=1 Tax=Hibiscus syriacus TaxID=106335 RepID=UPI00192082E6|nr:zinc finger protein-like 1 homolog [Hibiscus syriacus]